MLKLFSWVSVPTALLLLIAFMFLLLPVWSCGILGISSINKIDALSTIFVIQPYSQKSTKVRLYSLTNCSIVSHPGLRKELLHLCLPVLLISTISNFILTDSCNTTESAVFFICGLQTDCVRSNGHFEFTRSKIKQVLNYRVLYIFTWRMCFAEV